MISNSTLTVRRHIRRGLARFTVIALLTSTALFAGPPLICHPYNIGTAASLPGSGGDHWLGISKTYDRTNLVHDTLAFLTPSTPVMVRMETLRRAAIYATAEMRGWEKGTYTADDRALSAALLNALRDRAKDPRNDRALALFDAGFFAETLRQTNMDPGIDGYALLTEAATLRRNDPEIEFALALASVSPQRKDHTQHLSRARGAAKEGSLLAQNLATHFSKS